MTFPALSSNLPTPIFHTHFHSDLKLAGAFSLEPITFAASDA